MLILWLSSSKNMYENTVKMSMWNKNVFWLKWNSSTYWTFGSEFANFNSFSTNDVTKIPSITHRQTSCWVQLSSSSKPVKSLCSKRLCKCEALTIIRANSFRDNTSPSKSSPSWQSTPPHPSRPAWSRAVSSVTLVKSQTGSHSPWLRYQVRVSDYWKLVGPTHSFPRPWADPARFLCSLSPLLPALRQMSVWAPSVTKTQARSQSRGAVAECVSHSEVAGQVTRSAVSPHWVTRYLPHPVQAPEDTPGCAPHPSSTSSIRGSAINGTEHQDNR